MNTDETFSSNKHLKAERSQIAFSVSLLVWRLSEHCQVSENRNITVEFCGQALLRLISDAASGCRVYELLSIKRPAEVLHYVWATLPGSDLEPAISVRRNFDAEASAAGFSQPMGAVCSLSFLALNRCFWLDIEGTEKIAKDWFAFKQSRSWKTYVTALFNAVQVAQQRLQGVDDALLRFEMEKIALGQHYLDFEPTLERFGDLTNLELLVEDIPADVRALILQLAAQDNVRSVSLPFQDYLLWRGLLAIQQRRVTEDFLDPSEALKLNGPDSGIPWINNFWYRSDLQWGGEIHIPYEGFCSGDIFVFPNGFGFDAEYAKIASTLSAAAFGPNWMAYEKSCKYFLTKAMGQGELLSASRMVIGDWVLYTAKDL